MHSFFAYQGVISHLQYTEQSIIKKMQYCIHCIYNKFPKIVFLYDNFIWHWKELSLNFGIRDYAFEPEAQNMTNSRLIVVCASICVRIWSRICGNNTWMLSANGYRNALENIVSLHLCCQSYHPFDYSFNFMEISRVILVSFLFPRQIFYCYWWQNLRKSSWELSIT